MYRCRLDTFVTVQVYSKRVESMRVKTQMKVDADGQEGEAHQLTPPMTVAWHKKAEMSE